MNAASKRMAELTYGTPTIARGMAEVDPMRFGDAAQIALKHRVRGEARSYQPTKAGRPGRDRELKVQVLRRNIAAGRVCAEAMPALMRDYPELRSQEAAR